MFQKLIKRQKSQNKNSIFKLFVIPMNLISSLPTTKYCSRLDTQKYMRSHENSFLIYCKNHEHMENYILYFYYMISISFNIIM